MVAEGAVEQQVAGIIRSVLRVEVPEGGIDLIDSGLIDSLGLVSLLTELEAAFRFELPLEELDVDQFRTVGRIAELVGRYVSAAPASATAQPADVAGGAT